MAPRGGGANPSPAAILTLIENGDVYTPDPAGRRSVLLVDGKVARIGDVDREAVERLGLEHRVRGATGVFFTGGDQLRITSQIGDTPVYQGIRDVYERGGTVCGTSAGASVMTETMLVAGGSDESHRIGGALRLAPGLGLLGSVIVDQHLAERGRIGRLLGAVAQNPRIVGIGIDEDTAVIVERGRFRVLGSGAVYVVDGRHTTYSNLTSEAPDRAMSVFDVKLHVLSQGDAFDLRTRRPKGVPAEAAERVTHRESRTPTAV